MQRELGIGGLLVSISGEEFIDVARHGNATSAFGVVQSKSMLEIFVPFQSSVMA